MHRSNRLTQELLVLIVINRSARAISIDDVIIRITIFHDRITRTLPILSSLLCLVFLPNSNHLIIPDGTDRMSDKPLIGNIVTFLSGHLSIGIHGGFVFAIEVLDTVLVPRQRECSVPSEVLGIDVGGVDTQLDALIFHTS